MSYFANTSLGKILIGVWIVIPLLLIGLPVLGISQDEFLGNFAYAILACGVLVNISILIASKIKGGTEKAAKIIWVGLCLVIFGISMFRYGASVSEDIGIFLGWGMLIYAFPASLLVTTVVGGASYAAYKYFGFALKGGYIYLFCIWFFFFLAGYVQWFKLLPLLVTKWETRRRSEK